MPIDDHWFDSSQELLVLRSDVFGGYVSQYPQILFGRLIEFMARSVLRLLFLHQTTGKGFPGIKKDILYLLHNMDEMQAPSTVDVRILGNLNLIHRQFESLEEDIKIRDWRSDKTFVVSSNRPCSAKLLT